MAGNGASRPDLLSRQIGRALHPHIFRCSMDLQGQSVYLFSPLSFFLFLSPALHLFYTCTMPACLTCRGSIKEIYCQENPAKQGRERALCSLLLRLTSGRVSLYHLAWCNVRWRFYCHRPIMKCEKRLVFQLNPFELSHSIRQVMAVGRCAGQHCYYNSFLSV